MISKYIYDILNMKFNKNARIVLLAVYAAIMFSTIANEINIIVFVLLFAIIPVFTLFIVKQMFPKGK